MESFQKVCNLSCKYVWNEPSEADTTATLYVCLCMRVQVGYLWLGRACWQWCSWQRWWQHTPTPRGPPLWVTWTVSCLGAEHCACFYWASRPAGPPSTSTDRVNDKRDGERRTIGWNSSHVQYWQFTGSIYNLTCATVISVLSISDIKLYRMMNSDVHKGETKIIANHTVNG